jgi:hypothetical protein
VSEQCPSKLMVALPAATFFCASPSVIILTTAEYIMKSPAFSAIMLPMVAYIATRRRDVAV